MALADIVLGWHSSALFTYAGMLAGALIGRGLLRQLSVLRLGGAAIIASLAFFLISNFGVYLGGSHFNVNLPLVDPGLPLVPGAVTRILDECCRIAGADLLHLYHQPVAWHGAEPPFLCLPHQEAPDDISLILVDGGDFPKFLTAISRLRSAALR